MYLESILLDILIGLLVWVLTKLIELVFDRLR